MNNHRKIIKRWLGIAAAAAVLLSAAGCSSRQGSDSGEAGTGTTAEAAAAGSGSSRSGTASTVTREQAERLALAGEEAGSSGESDGTTGSTGTAGSTDYAAAAEPGSGETASSSDTGSAAEEFSGRIINIYCWNDTLENIFISYYPGYTDNGDATGTLEGYKIRWMMPEDEDSYMEFVAEKLLRENSLEQDERVDLYLAPEETLAIFVNSDYSEDLRGETGLTDDDLSDQYEFMIQAGTDEDNVLKAVSWLACPGVFAYRRSIAKDVLGSDDPRTVQEAVSDWNSFTATAAAAKEKGYEMLSGYDDAFAVFRCASRGQWVQNRQLQIGSAVSQWRDLAKNFTDNGYSGTTNVGDSQWVANQGPAGNVFGFFRASEDIDTKLLDNSITNADGSTASDGGIYGDYGVCVGPQAYKRGGTWILAAPGSDNTAMDLEILRTLTGSRDFLMQIAEGENLFTNTVSGMQTMAQEDHADTFLGGQNPYAVYNEAAQSVTLSAEGNYDWTLAGIYRSNMRGYFKGERSADEAQAAYMDDAMRKYPELEAAGDDSDDGTSSDGGAADAEIATGE